MRETFVLLTVTLFQSASAAQNADTGRVFPEDEVDIRPALLRQPPPIYSDSLRRAGIGGTVTVTVVLDTAGHPEPGSVRVIATSNGALNASASAMILGSAFSPGQLHGQRIRCQSTTIIKFDPHDASPPPPPVYTTRDSLEREPRFSHWRPVMGPSLFSPIDSAQLAEATLRGRLVIQMIIDSLGHPDTASIQIVEPSDQRLVSAVSRYVALMQFTPARRGGRPVSVLVTQPLLFERGRAR